MKVILTEEVLGLGDPGEVVEIKRGYGRNYLIPRGVAIEATKKNLSMIEAEQARYQAKAAREADKVKSEADALAAVSLTVQARAGETGKLYGSVTNMDLAAALAEKGFDLDRRRIIMEDGPIKELGEHTIRVKLHPQVVVEIPVLVEAAAGSAQPEAAQPEAAEAEPEQAEAAQPAEEAVEAAETEAAEEAEAVEEGAEPKE